MIHSLLAAVTTHLFTLPPWLALLAVFGLPALESSAFVGFVFPGETALIVGGVLAAHGTVPLAAVILVGVLGAVLGDSIGYAVGRRLGRRLLDGAQGRWIRRHHVDRAERYLAERGGRAVFLGRFTAALRVLVPGLAGMARMPYRVFLRYNVAGGVLWGTGAVLLGYLGGASLQHAAHLASEAGLVALALLAGLVAASFLRHRAETAPSRRAADPVAGEVGPLPPAVPDAAPGAPGRALVVVPTYNEADNITTLLDAVLAAAPEADVLVVDDDSPDGTAALVRAHPAYCGDVGRVHLLSRRGRQGLGPAYRAGFGWALARGYPSVVQMDADLSHPPHRIPALLAALTTHDVAVGSRYVAGGGIRDWTRTRRFVSRAGNQYVRMVLRLPVRDATAGFKAFRRSALVLLDTGAASSNGYCFQVENAWRAARLGLRVTEVPITFTDRTAGRSKMSARIVLEALVRVLGWRWRDRAAAVPATAAAPRPWDVEDHQSRHASV